MAAMVSLAAVSREVYQRHFQPQSAQRFTFGAGPTATISGRADLSQVADAHIFGTVPPVAKPAVQVEPEPVEAPKTRLALKLTGVITSPLPDAGRAMIEIKRGETGVVRVGEEIGKTGATLHAVFKDHILIEHRGKRERLEIIRPEMGITDLRNQNDNTVKALNINVSEFEALARVNPEDVDISKLLPQQPRAANTAPAVNQSTDTNLDQISQVELEQLEALEKQEEAEELQRLLDSGELEPEEIEQVKAELERLQ